MENGDKTPVSLQDMQPFVRYAHVFEVAQNAFFATVCAYDCRLMYVLRGEGNLCLDGQDHAVRPGQVFLWQPGTAYRFSASDSGGLRVIGVNFDFTCAHAAWDTPIAPARPEAFREDAILERVWFTDFAPFNTCVCVDGAHLLEQPLMAICKEYTAQKMMTATKLRGLLLALLADLARLLLTAPDSADAADGTAEIDRVIRYIHERYAQPLTNRSVGEQFHFHPAYLSRLMIRHTGYPLHQYLIRYRLQTAFGLLQTTALRVTEVAFRVGFFDANYFTRCFKKAYGFCPRECQIGAPCERE